MRKSWELVFHTEAVEKLMTSRSRERQNLTRALEKLLVNPYLKPSFEE